MFQDSASAEIGLVECLSVMTEDGVEVHEGDEVYLLLGRLDFMDEVRRFKWADFGAGGAIAPGTADDVLEMVARSDVGGDGRISGVFSTFEAARAAHIAKARAHVNECKDQFEKAEADLRRAADVRLLERR